MNHSSRLGRLLVLALVVVLSATACTPAATPTATPVPPTKAPAAPTTPPAAAPTTAPTTAPAAPTAVPTTAPTAAPKPSGLEKTLRIAYGIEVANLDPAVANEPESAMATLAVYENLVRYKGSTTEVEGRLAKSWEVSADGKVYTFKLYDNIKFQDGTVCDAAAVKFSLERMIKMNKGPAKILAAVDTIDAVDAVTVRFNLKYSYPAFLYELCNHMGVQIVSPKAVKDNATADDPYAAKWFAKNMVGTGPYKLEKWDVGRQISFVKNESYWKGWTGNHIEKIVIELVKESPTRRLMLEKGDTDMAWRVAMEDMIALDSVKGVVTPEQQTMNLLYVGFNNKSKPLDNVKVRQAISYAFDYDAVVKTFMKGYALKGWGPMAQNMWGHNKNMPQYTLDMAKAKQLLTEAGYANGGFSITFNYLTTAPEQRQIGEMLQASLSKLGIELKLQAQTWAALTALVWNPKTDPYMFTIYIWPEVPDPHNYLYNWFHTSQIGNDRYNGFQYSNAEVDKLLDQAKMLMDKDARIKLYNQAQEIINREAASIFSHTPTRTHAWSLRDNVKGFAFNPLYIGTLDYWSLYKE